MANNIICKHTKCAICGGVKLKSAYVGVINLNTKCSAKCQMAQKDACECKCNGKFHKGANSKVLNKILNPSKKPAKKIVNKKSLAYIISRFEPENLTDELAEFLAKTKINTNSFTKFSDRNYISPNLNRNWLRSKSNGGKDLDLLAKDFIDQSNRDYDAQDIVQNIVEYIVDNETGSVQYFKKRLQEQKEDLEAYYIRQDEDFIYVPEDFDFDFSSNAPEDLFVNGIKNKKMIKLKKGSAQAKAFMAKIRAMKGKNKVAIKKTIAKRNTNNKVLDDIPDRGYKKISLDFRPIKKIGAVNKKVVKRTKSKNLNYKDMSGVNNIMELKRDLDKTIVLLNDAKMGTINKNGPYYEKKLGITTFKNITAKKSIIRDLTKQYKILKELFVNTKKLKLKANN